MQTFSLKCFGVGDGWPSTGRNHSSFLYQLGGTNLLIDCGEPISRVFQQSGLSYDEIDRILLSHLHFDHIGGFFMLMQGFWLKQRRKELPVHLPADGIEPIRQLLNAACIFEELLGFKLRFEPLRAREALHCGAARVTPFSTTHLESFRKAFAARYPQDYAAYSFLIEVGHLRIAHSADLGAPEDLAPLLTQPLDLLVCELAHFKPEDLFRYLKGRAIQRVVFVHLTQRLWENLHKVRALATSQLGGIPFSFARDGEEITLGEISASEVEEDSSSGTPDLSE